MQGRLEDYDPRRTDVWAAGVMLVVTLLGAFPFDHTANNTAGTTDDELDLWWGHPAVPCCSLCLLFLAHAHCSAGMPASFALG